MHAAWICCQYRDDCLCIPWRTSRRFQQHATVPWLVGLRKERRKAAIGREAKVQGPILHSDLEHDVLFKGRLAKQRKRRQIAYNDSRKPPCHLAAAWRDARRLKRQDTDHAHVNRAVLPVHHGRRDHNHLLNLPAARVAALCSSRDDRKQGGEDRGQEHDHLPDRAKWAHGPEDGPLSTLFPPRHTIGSLPSLRPPLHPFKRPLRPNSKSHAIARRIARDATVPSFRLASLANPCRSRRRCSQQPRVCPRSISAARQRSYAWSTACR